MAIAAALLLTSCGDSTPTPMRGEGLRAGADLSARAGTSLPRAFGTGQYDGTLTRSDEQSRREDRRAGAGARWPESLALGEGKGAGGFAAAQARKRADEDRQIAKPAESPATPRKQQ
jgi:hypothetical protein